MKGRLHDLRSEYSRWSNALYIRAENREASMGVVKRQIHSRDRAFRMEAVVHKLRTEPEDANSGLRNVNGRPNGVAQRLRATRGL